LITLTVNNQSVSVDEGTTVAVAVMSAAVGPFRRSVSGEPRFPLCGMGICFECRVTINGVKHQRSCQTLVEEEMIVETDE